MKHLHRWLILPAVVVLVAVTLIMLDILPVDPGVDIPLLPFAVTAGLVLLIALSIEGYQAMQRWQLPEPEDPPHSDKVIHPQPLDEAVDEAEQFAQKATERVRIEIDVEDARDD